jgi:hypothetical protein
MRHLVHAPHRVATAMPYLSHPSCGQATSGQQGHPDQLLLIDTAPITIQSLPDVALRPLATRVVPTHPPLLPVEPTMDALSYPSRMPIRRSRPQVHAPLIGRRLHPIVSTAASPIFFCIHGIAVATSHRPSSLSLSKSWSAYDVLVKFFPCMVYIDSNQCDTLRYK